MPSPMSVGVFEGFLLSLPEVLRPSDWPEIVTDSTDSREDQVCALMLGFVIPQVEKEVRKKLSGVLNGGSGNGCTGERFCLLRFRNNDVVYFFQVFRKFV